MRETARSVARSGAGSPLDMPTRGEPNGPHADIERDAGDGSGGSPTEWAPVTGDGSPLDVPAACTVERRRLTTIVSLVSSAARLGRSRGPEPSGRRPCGRGAAELDSAPLAWLTPESDDWTGSETLEGGDKGVSGVGGTLYGEPLTETPYRARRRRVLGPNGQVAEAKDESVERSKDVAKAPLSSSSVGSLASSSISPDVAYHVFEGE